jgi:hypothetical protein
MTMTQSKGLLTLFVALVAFGCAAAVRTGQASRHEDRPPSGAGIELCLAMMGMLPAWRSMKPGRQGSDANPLEVLEIAPSCGPWPVATD